MSTDAEKLAQITALCEEMAQSRGGARHAADDLAAILTEPGPAVTSHEPGPKRIVGRRTSHQCKVCFEEWPCEASKAAPAHGINYRDHVAEAIRLARQRWVGGPDYEFDLVLADAVLAVGTAIRPHAIDRDAILDILRTGRHARDFAPEDAADRILALVRPVEGVTLTTEEVQAVLALHRYWRENWIPPLNDRALIRTLAARLEASS